jgi:hypothetical protein
MVKEPRKVVQIEVGEECYESSPCCHDVTLVFQDGSSATIPIMNAQDISNEENN